MTEERIYPTLTDESCVSHLNFEGAARSGLDLPPRVRLRDQTLREGEQASLSGFTAENKLEIARLLDEAGVDEIEVGYPGWSGSEDAMIARMVGLGLKARFGGVCLVYLDEWRRFIESAARLKLHGVSVVYGLSAVRLQKMMRLPLEKAVARCLDATAYAKDKGLEVSFIASDTPRTELGVLQDLYCRAVEKGASTVGVADTAGSASPTAIRYLVRELKKATGVPVSIHCHNDVGLAIANAVAGLEGGAEIIESCVNGLGERAGNSSLIEVVAVLKYMYGYDLDVRMERLTHLCRRVEEMSGIAIPSTGPLLGEMAYTHTLGAHQWGVHAGGWYVYEPIRPEALGQTRRLPIGRLTHRLIVKEKLADLGVRVEEEGALDRITEDIRRLAEEKGDFVTDEELLRAASYQTKE